MISQQVVKIIILQMCIRKLSINYTTLLLSISVYTVSLKVRLTQEGAKQNLNIMKIDTFQYKAFTGEVFYYPEIKNFGAQIETFSAFADTPKEAIEKVSENLDKFLEVPKTFEDLAVKLEDCLEWHSYEDCNMNVTLMELTLKNFVNNNFNLFQ